MRENRIFALCYRCAAFMLCLAGILATAGAFAGRFNWRMLLYYTTESNIMVLAMFGALIAKTAAGIKKGGTEGGCSYFERLSAIVMLSITVTLIVFWLLLAPYFGGGMGLLTFTNMQVHAITPLLMIFDYFLFAEPGKLKKHDPWIFAVIPLGYFAQSTALGFSGFKYGGLSSAPATRFPYFFLDFDLIGSRVFLYVLALTVFFMALAYLLLWYDRRRGGLAR
ncbi:MAG: Pr6Pr family membrane protein [Oscillospiraceae bacterium]|jgi:hypothetical protein|nr:Pr6Pr family membrane protein [Oscillospiraceae bacterium]